MSILDAAVNPQCVLLRLGRVARAVSELYVCEGRCSCSARARLQTSRSSETGHSRALGSTSCEITLTEGGRVGASERGKEPLGGSRGISGPAHSHASVSSSFYPHGREEKQRVGDVRSEKLYV